MNPSFQRKHIMSITLAIAGFVYPMFLIFLSSLYVIDKESFAFTLKPLLWISIGVLRPLGLGEGFMGLEFFFIPVITFIIGWFLGSVIDNRLKKNYVVRGAKIFAVTYLTLLICVFGYYHFASNPVSYKLVANGYEIDMFYIKQVTDRNDIEIAVRAYPYNSDREIRDMKVTARLIKDGKTMTVTDSRDKGIYFPIINPPFQIIVEQLTVYNEQGESLVIPINRKIQIKKIQKT